MNSSSQWEGPIKIYLLPELEACQCASLGCVLLPEVKVSLGGVAFRLGDGNDVCITTLQGAAKPSVFLSLLGARSHCTDGTTDVLEGEGTCLRSARD